MNFQPEVLFIEEGAEDYPLTRHVLKKLSVIPVRHIAETESVVDEIKRTSPDVFGAGKKHLVLSRFKGSLLKKCPGISPGMVCCNYYIVNLMKNCIYDCSYCFLQGFLENNPLLVAFMNVDDFLAELNGVFEAHPERNYRVGTGELADSLALEELLPYSDQLIPFFNERKKCGSGTQNQVRPGGGIAQTGKHQKCYRLLVAEPATSDRAGRKRHPRPQAAFGGGTVMP